MSLLRHSSKEPLWKDEFSIHSSEERYVTRRQLTKFLVLTSFGMFIGNLWILIRSWLHRAPSYPSQVIAATAEIPVGGVRLFNYPDPQHPCILIRTGEDSYAAYSQKCTHLSCAVYYSAEDRRIECPCHRGYFSARNGEVLQGPPPRPLPRIVLERRGDDLAAVAIELRGES